MIVLTAILSVFAIAVRLSFTRSLSQQLNLRLENLAQTAAFNMDNEEGELDVDEDEIIVGEEQAVEWFDLDREIVEQQGEYELNIPLNIERLSEIQSYSNSIRTLAIPVYSWENETELIGYIRVSQSLTEFKNTLRRLDYGLGSGIAIAFFLGGFSSLWLTRRAMQPIEASFARLKQFTADASHELRSPLMAIRTNADVALKYPEGMRDTDAEKFTAIASATAQMTDLTESLLFLARSDLNKKLPARIIDLSSILQSLGQFHQPNLEFKKLIYHPKVAPNLLILGDETLLNQLFNNLLENAIYYTNPGGTITINAQKDQRNSIIIKVSDTGIGITPEHLDKIFERFWRVDKSRSYQTGRSGLGLAIVKEIVRLHGGKIIVESELGVGSCFIVHLPVQVSQY